MNKVYFNRMCSFVKSKSHFRHDNSSTGQSKPAKRAILLAAAITGLIAPLPAYAIEAASAVPSGASDPTSGGCNAANVNFTINVTATTNDVADPAAPIQGDRFVVRLVDADGNIIASNGYIYPVGTVFTSGSAIQVGNRDASADTLVAPTSRPFHMEIFESITSATGARYAASGSALYTSPSFDPYDPSGATGFNASVCASLPGGASIPDTTPPVITVPANMLVNTDAGEATATVTYSVSAIDDVDGAIPATATPASGSAFSVGTTTVNVSATDAAGNLGTNSFTVTVADTEAPVVTVPTNIIIGTDAGQATAVVDFTTSAQDNVDGAVPTVATPASGSAFPIGTTTVNVSASDAAGNAGAGAFTVTVADDELPVFTSTQANINVDIDFGTTTAVVTFPTPTATDNSGAISVTLLGGLASGSAFPVGTTLVTFQAEDGAGNIVQQSFTVTVAVIPPGGVEFVVNSPADTTVSFTAAEPTFNFDVVTTGGTGSSGTLLIRPGTYPMSFTVSEGIGITGASCSDANGVINAGAQTATITLASGQNYVCTLSIVDSATDTAAVIQSFIDTRAQMILANQPNIGRRLSRLNGQPSGNSVSIAGQQVVSGKSPIDLVLDEGIVEISLSTSSFDNIAGRDSSLWDFWVEASYSTYETTTDEGDFVLVHVGADYLLTPNSLLGVSVQYDEVDQLGLASAASISGNGWMIGPYYTHRLSDRLYLDASVKWGEANNTVSPLGTYTDSFGSTRMLATLAVIGDHDIGAVNIRPEFRLNYFTETTDAYTDGLAVFIASQETHLGEAKLAAKFSITKYLENESTLIPFVTVDGIWTLENSDASGLTNTVSEGLRGRLGAGFDLFTANGIILNAALSYDGLGDDNFEAWSADIGFERKF